MGVYFSPHSLETVAECQLALSCREKILVSQWGEETQAAIECPENMARVIAFLVSLLGYPHNTNR